jgi:hypothetical protein
MSLRIPHSRIARLNILNPHAFAGAHYEKPWTTKKLAHHSEPQIGSSFDSYRCSTAHVKGLHCCAKDFHRVTSDSDCRTMLYRSEIPRRRKDQGYSHDSLHNFRNLVTYHDTPITLKSLGSHNVEDSKQKELGIKPQRTFFGGLEKLYINKDALDSGYSKQEAQEAPKDKRRKCGNEGIASCDNNTIYILSNLGDRDE